MNMEAINAVSLVTAITGVSVSIIFEIASRARGKKEQKEKEDVAQKIEGISESLNESAAELVDMQKQLNERIALVEALTAKAKQAEASASLNKQQVDAVNEIISGNLKRGGRRGFWRRVLVNFIFFILGAAASYCVLIFLT